MSVYGIYETPVPLGFGGTGWEWDWDSGRADQSGKSDPPRRGRKGHPAQESGPEEHPLPRGLSLVSRCLTGPDETRRPRQVSSALSYLVVFRRFGRTSTWLVGRACRTSGGHGRVYSVNRIARVPRARICPPTHPVLTGSRLPIAPSEQPRKNHFRPLERGNLASVSGKRGVCFRGELPG